MSAALPWSRFTVEQLRAALLVDRPVVSAAGAGAGKTAVMAVRYGACLLSRGDDGRLLGPERILAITFTREASTNLRSRVDRTLRAALAPGVRRFPAAGGSGDTLERALSDEEVAHLQYCLAELPAAPITTFDGFCLELVREHAARLGRDPELAPPDDLGRRACHEIAWSELRQEAVAAGGGDLGALVRAWGQSSARATIQRLAEQRSTLPRPALRQHDQDLSALVVRMRGELLDRLSAALSKARALTKPGSATARDLSAAGDRPAGQGAELRAWLLALAAVKSAGSDELKHELRLIQDLIDHPNCRDGEGKRPSPQARLKRASLACLAVWDENDERDCRELASALGRQVERFAALSTIAAERRGLAGFARIEAEALQLAGDPATARILGRRFRHVLLDEAQDFNRLQAELVGCLRGEGARIFTVGDHRQSIFGFRHAAPEVFARWETEVVAFAGEAIPLGRNFRSHPEVVAAVKTIFGQPSLRAAFRPESIEAGRPAEGRARVALWRVPPPADDQGVVPRAGSRAASEAQAAQVARLIAASIADGRGAGEHAIVLRKRSRMRLYAVALERAGIAYDTDFPGGLYDSQECHDVEAILRLALDPRDRFAWGVALGGPWGTLDPQDKSLLVEALTLGLDHPEIVARLARETRIGPVVASCRAALIAEGVAPAIRGLASQPALTARYGRLPLARRRLANLALLAEEEDGAGRPLDAVDYVARLAERRRLGADGGEAGGEALGGRGVRLMTIHGAKGLEWPAVYLPECDGRLDARDLTAPALGVADAEGLLVAVHPPPPEDDDAERGISLAAGLLQDALFRRLQDEEARLFYVACTRARDELHCLVSSDPAGPASDGTVASCADWLAASGLPWSVPDPGSALPAARSTEPGTPLPALRVSPVDDHGEVRALTMLLDASSAGAATGVDRELNRVVGICVHLALERCGPGMTDAQARASLAAVRDRIPAARYAALISALTDPLLIPGYWDGARLIEQGVIAELVPGDAARLVSGRCDLLLKRGEDWILYDYKSGAGADRETARLQIRCYAHMLRPWLDAPLAEAWLVSVEDGTRQEVALGEIVEAAAWEALTRAWLDDAAPTVTA